MKLCLVCNFQFGDEQEMCPKDLSKLVPIGKDPLIGKLIQDRYRVLGVIGKGSMGTVYKAVQELIGREVAVKVMHGYLVSDDESLKRYHKEAKSASRLNHPNIITIFDFGVLATGQPYIVMDLLAGRSLYDILKERGSLTISQTLMVFQPVCQAIAEAHKRGVVHRDLKPENIVVEENAKEKTIHVKVVDFGIATFLVDSDDTIGKITKTGTVCGSPFYMSPEQCDGSKMDHRSDLYSLGVVLFETLTGKLPFEDKDVYKVLTMQVKNPPPKLKSLRPELDFPQALETFVQKSLAKDPESRYQSAEEFWQALATASGVKLAAGLHSGPSPGPTLEQIPELMKRKRPEEAASAAAELGKRPDKQGQAADDVSPGKISEDEIRRRINAVTQKLEGRGESQAPERSNGGVSLRDRFVGFMQLIMPPVLTIALTCMLFWMITHEATIHSAILSNQAKPPQKSATKEASIDALIAQEKLAEARSILEKRRKTKTLSADDLHNLNWVYIKLAGREARQKNYKQALNLMEQVSAEERDQDEVKLLMRKYRRLAGR